MEVNDLVQQIRDLITHGDVLHGLAVSDKLLQRYPDNPHGLSLRAHCLLQSERPEDALKDVTLALKNPNMADVKDAFVLKATAEVHCGHLKDAEKTLKDCQKLCGESSEFLFTSMVLSFAKGDLQTADKLAKSILALEDKVGNAIHLTTALSVATSCRYIKEGKVDSPNVKDAQELSKEAEDNAVKRLGHILPLIDRLVMRGETLIGNGDINAGISSLEEALMIARSTCLTSKISCVAEKLSMAYRLAGRADRSASTFVGAGSTLAELRSSASTMIINGNLADAVDVLERARALIDADAQLKDFLPSILNNLGVTYSLAGDIDESISYYEIAADAAQEARDVTMQVQALNGLSAKLVERKDYGDGIEVARTALGLHEAMYSALVEGGSGEKGTYQLYHDTFMGTYKTIAEAFHCAGDHEAALEWIERGKSFGFTDPLSLITTEEGSNDVTFEEILQAADVEDTNILSFYALNNNKVLGSLVRPMQRESKVSGLIKLLKQRVIAVEIEVGDISELAIDVSSYMVQVALESQKKEDVNSPSLGRRRRVRASHTILANLYEKLIKPFEKYIHPTEEDNSASSPTAPEGSPEKNASPESTHSLTLETQSLAQQVSMATFTTLTGGSNAKNLIIIPDTCFAQVPWQMLMSDPKKPLETALGTSTNISVASCAAEVVRGSKHLRLGPLRKNLNVSFVKDISVPHVAEMTTILSALQDEKTISLKEFDSVSSICIEEGNSDTLNIVHLCVHATSKKVCGPKEATVETVFDKKVVVQQRGAAGKVSKYVLGDASTPQDVLCGYLFVDGSSDQSVGPDDVANLTMKNAVAIDDIPTKFKFPKGTIVYADWIGNASDLFVPHYSSTLTRALLAAGAAVVLIPRFPVTGVSNSKENVRAAFAGLFYTNLSDAIKSIAASKEPVTCKYVEMPESTGGDVEDPQEMNQLCNNLLNAVKDAFHTSKAHMRSDFEELVDCFSMVLSW